MSTGNCSNGTGIVASSLRKCSRYMPLAGIALAVCLAATLWFGLAASDAAPGLNLPTAAPSTGVVAADANRIGDQLRQLARATEDPAVAKWTEAVLPYALARLGAKRETLAAMGNDLSPEDVERMLASVFVGQMLRGDKAAATVTAEDALNTALALKNITATENARVLEIAVTPLLLLGEVQKVRQRLAAAGIAPESISKVARAKPGVVDISQLVRSFDPMKDVRAAALTDIGSRKMAYQQVLSSLEQKIGMYADNALRPVTLQMRADGLQAMCLARAGIVETILETSPGIKSDRDYVFGELQNAVYSLVQMGAAESIDLALARLKLDVVSVNPTSSLLLYDMEQQGYMVAAAKLYVLGGRPGKAAECLLKAGEKDQARRVAADAIRIVQEDAQWAQPDAAIVKVAALSELADILARCGDTAGAAAALAKLTPAAQTIIVREQPAINALAAFVRAQNAAKLTADAKKNVSRLVDAASSLPKDAYADQTRCIIADGLSGAGEPAAAKTVASQITSQPTWQIMAAWAHIGASYWAKAEKEAATGAFAEAVKVAGKITGSPPQNYFAAVATMQAEAGDYAGALQTLRTPSKIPVGQEAAHVAEIMAAHGDMDRAAQALECVRSNGVLYNFGKSRIAAIGSRAGKGIAAARGPMVPLPLKPDNPPVIEAASAGNIDAVLKSLNVTHTGEITNVVYLRFKAGDIEGAMRILNHVVQVSMDQLAKVPQPGEDLAAQSYSVIVAAAELMDDLGRRQDVARVVAGIAPKAAAIIGGRAGDYSLSLLARIARLQFRAVSFDAAFQWAKSLPNKNTRTRTLQNLTHIVLEPYFPEGPNGYEPRMRTQRSTSAPSTRP